jgi:phage repressor protein C with HTH and peptisase S24 domain
MPVGFGDGFVSFPTRDRESYALRCRGDSMKPRIKDGEFVIVEPNHTPSPGDEVLVKAKDGRIMVKELLFERDGNIHLLSVNEAHGKVVIPREDIDHMHYVAAIMKRAMWEME